MTVQEVLEDIRSGRKKKVILDTDTYNEVDDQYALAYCYLSEKIDLLAVQAAPFENERSENFADGMERSYQEIHRILRMTDPEYRTPVFRGSVERITDTGKAVDSDSCDNLIRMVKESKEPIYVLAIGAITNVDSAIMKDPSIKENMVVVWLGANDLTYRDNQEFNLCQDRRAGQFILDCGVPLLLCPAHFVTAKLTADIDTVRELKGANPLCDYLASIIEECYESAGKPEDWFRVIWDIAAPSILATPECAEIDCIPAPVLTDDYHYEFPEGRHEILFLRKIHREIVFAETWKLLKAGKSAAQ